MRSKLSVLLLVLTLLSSFSVAQSVKPLSPFERYLTRVRSGEPEPSLVRFATECGVDLKTTTPHFAKAPGNKWLMVKSFAHALEDQEMDYYGTATVWTSNRMILIEYWGVDLEQGMGMQARKLFCLRDRQIQQVEQIDWEFFEYESIKGPIKAHWLGYEQRWSRRSETSYTHILSRYIDRSERTVTKPENEAEIPDASDESPNVFTWEDMKLPSTLLH
jgi:hypothetical protein